MKAFLGRPLVQRFVGAIGAGAATYIANGHDWRAASIAALTFLIYGSAHVIVAKGGE